MTDPSAIDRIPRSQRLSTWLIQPLSKEIRQRVERMADSDDVAHVAVMPDVHLAEAYCVGTVVATASQIMPHAVGGDIGCGMAGVRVNAAAERLTADALSARRLLRMLRSLVPGNKRRRETLPSELPRSLAKVTLSDPRLDKIAQREGRYQLGTLGRGNHFLEFQSDADGALWLMIHSGSRAMGQAITQHHLRQAENGDPLPYLVADSPAGQAYLNDVDWARSYARENRSAMLRMTAELLKTLWSVDIDEGSFIESDHNHVVREQHLGRWLWVHRKGAQSARAEEAGIIPGSMGTPSYHVVGRGCVAALQSSAHGAGRQKSRREAHESISVKTLEREMRGVFFDTTKSRALRDEAPSAYKNIQKVMRAQKDLVKIVRVLQPLLSYKGV